MKKVFQVEGVNHEELRELIKQCYYRRRPLFIWGPPGIGKSYSVRDAAREIARELNLKYSEDPRDYRGVPDKFVLIDVRASQLDPVDWRGIPIVILRTNGVEKIIVNPHNLEISNHVFARTSWAPPAFLPDEGHGMIFLDELNLAVLSTQHAAYQLILDRRLGEYVLPEGWVVVAAGNRQEDVPTVFEMSKALENRFLHVELKPPDHESWTRWAARNEIDPRIIGFINYRSSLLFKYDPRSKEKAFPTPRSWEFASDMIKKVPTTEYKRLYIYVRSAVGEGAAREFIAFLKLREKLPNLREILEYPERAKDITDLSLLHALVTNVAEYYAAKKSIERLRKAVLIAQYIPPEFAYLLFFLTKAVDPDFWINAVLQIPEFDPIAKKWIKKGYLLD